MNRQLRFRSFLDPRNVAICGTALALLAAAAHSEAATKPTVVRIETSRFDHAPEVVGLTNACVDAITTRAYAAAEAPCDAAIRAARLDFAFATPLSRLYTGDALRETIALTYSNRAVLHSLTGDSAGATSDFAKAKAMSPKSTFIAANDAIASETIRLARE